MEEDKIFFMPGDIVSIRQDIPNKPIMIMKDKASNMIRGANAYILKVLGALGFLLMVSIKRVFLILRI